MGHKDGPDDATKKVKCLVKLKGDRDGTDLQTGIIWLQIPIRKDQLEGFERAAWQEGKSVFLFVQEALFEKLNAPRDFPEATVF